MNIEEYKRAMQEVYVSTDKIKLRFQNTIDEKMKHIKIVHPHNFNKKILVCVMSFILIFVLVNFIPLTKGDISKFTITVYASDLNKELFLSKTPITLSTSNQFNIQAITNEGKDSETGSINFDLNFKCEGKNIRKITYQLSDKTISRENRGEAVAWFAENDDSYGTFPDSTSNEDVSVYRSYRDNTNHTCYVTKMIGNSYSVDYENQNDKQYALEINLFQNEKGELEAKKFTITVILTLDDGSTLEKHILVRPLIADTSEYDISKIAITLK